jgi:hypothetical protein
MANLVKTGLGGSRIAKEAEKDYYWKPELLIPGAGIEFQYVDLTTKEELEAASHDSAGRLLYPQASQTRVGLQVTTSGYTGTISGTYALEIANGLIVDASVIE